LSRSSIWLHSFQGTFALLAKGPVCNPCLQNELSPISQEGHFRPSKGSDRPLDHGGHLGLRAAANTAAIIDNSRAGQWFDRHQNGSPAPII